MKKDVKYYRVTLFNPFEENDLKQDVIVVSSDIDGRGLLYEGRELLTNKKIFMCDLFHYGLRTEVILFSFINKECELIGGNFDELNEEFVIKFLKFTSREDIDKIVDNIVNIEESLKNSIKNTQNEETKSKK